ncbi:MAG: hypothetical protein OXF01_09760, partial [Gemmatimonadetes bacterium]|nr:hypothetical protein [Gemmatimonadota bacterium]
RLALVIIVERSKWASSGRSLALKRGGVKVTCRSGTPSGTFHVEQSGECEGLRALHPRETFHVEQSQN